MSNISFPKSMKLGSRQKEIIEGLMKSEYRCHLASHVMIGSANDRSFISVIKLVEREILKHYTLTVDKNGDRALPQWTKNELKRLQQRMKANPRGSSFYLIPDRYIDKFNKGYKQELLKRLVCGRKSTFAKGCEV
jgi:hypothetical protein